jgi:anti-sigma factor RsiW
LTRNSEQLSAFLDGELTEAETEMFEKALLIDPHLRAQLQQLCEANAVARSEFAAILDEPVSARLVSTIWQTPIAAKD